MLSQFAHLSNKPVNGITQNIVPGTAFCSLHQKGLTELIKVPDRGAEGQKVHFQSGKEVLGNKGNRRSEQKQDDVF